MPHLKRSAEPLWNNERPYRRLYFRPAAALTNRLTVNYPGGFRSPAGEANRTCKLLHALVNKGGEPEFEPKERVHINLFRLGDEQEQARREHRRRQIRLPLNCSGSRSGEIRPTVGCARNPTSGISPPIFSICGRGRRLPERIHSWPQQIAYGRHEQLRPKRSPFPWLPGAFASRRQNASQGLSKELICRASEFIDRALTPLRAARRARDLWRPVGSDSS